MFKSVLCGVVIAISFSSIAVAGSVGASGFVFNQSGSPLPNGLVVIGTFKSTFDAHNYKQFYADGSGNLEPNAYSQAVASGNFIPIANDLTDSFGAFAATGTSAEFFSQLWMFAFDGPMPDTFFQVLATSNASNWSVQFGPTVIGATQANDFVLGVDHPLGVQLSVVPFPEPAAATLAGCGAVAISCIRRRARR